MKNNAIWLSYEEKLVRMRIDIHTYAFLAIFCPILMKFCMKLQETIIYLSILIFFSTGFERNVGVAAKLVPKGLGTQSLTKKLAHCAKLFRVHGQLLSRSIVLQRH